MRKMKHQNSTIIEPIMDLAPGFCRSGLLGRIYKAFGTQIIGITWDILMNATPGARLPEPYVLGHTT
jgi:hypothetical protein